MLWRKENETPGWTQLKLPGQAPSPRCGHTVTSSGHYVMTFSSFSFLIFLHVLGLLLLSGIIVMSNAETDCKSFLCLQLLLFGGHGTGGWLSRYDIYYTDCVVLDRGECFSTLLVDL